MRRCRPLLGTFVEIEAKSETAIGAGFAAIEAVHAAMSAHEPESELSRLNRSNRENPVTLGPLTSAVLERARHWHARSAGLFDPARAGARALKQGRLPRHSGQQRPAPDSDFGALRIEAEQAWLEEPACLDLGGIAKGHAVDEAIAAMRAAGASEGLVNAGGDLAVFGHPRAIEIVTPHLRHACIQLEIIDRAVATSAGLRDGAQLDFAHLPDGNPGVVSVTVEAPLAIDADALTKIAWAGHADLAAMLLEIGARALAVDHAGNVIDPAGRRRAA